MSISFHFQKISKPEFFQPSLMRHWLRSVAKKKEIRLEELNYIFVGDETLLEINREYLHHNTYTDIITFNNSETGDAIEADIFISLERVKENAKKFKVAFEKELARVMAHGLLHLLGLNDKTVREKKIIRAEEEDCIRLYVSVKRKIKKP